PCSHGRQSPANVPNVRDPGETARLHSAKPPTAPMRGRIGPLRHSCETYAPWQVGMFEYRSYCHFQSAVSLAFSALRDRFKIVTTINRLTTPSTMSNHKPGITPSPRIKYIAPNTNARSLFPNGPS